MNVKASIDIGSNSVLLLIAQTQPFQELYKDSEVTSLGKGLDQTGVFSEDSMLQTYNVLKRYLSKSREYHLSPSDVLATATEAARVAKNSKEFFATIKKDLGLEIKIITGNAEANLTTMGLLMDTHIHDKVINVMDIGGASTELIKVSVPTKSIIHSVSLPIGSVRISDWINAGHYEAKFAKIMTDFSSELDTFVGDHLYCVAGTMTSLGNMSLQKKTFVEDEVHGMVLERSQIEALFRDYQSWSPDQLSQAFPFLGKRVMAMRGGLSLAYHLIQRLRVKRIQISTYGLRYGLISLSEIPLEFIAK